VTVSTDLEQGTVHAIVEIAAPPEAVFNALTDPAQLERWWGSDQDYRTSDWVVDLRVGGQWSCQATNTGDGRSSSVRGEYLAIEAPRLLEYTWCPSWEGFQSSTIRCELEPTATGTRLTIDHGGFQQRPTSASGHAEGWQRVLGWLTDYAESVRV
jgi:uncharacterized protein YndB with AHSA1/START domain